MMQATTQQRDKRQGSAMILVVVVTVLLAVVGVMFVMVARLGEMESAAVLDNADLAAAVRSVVSRINAVLVEDLFGEGDVIGDGGPTITWPGEDPVTGDRVNPWLAALEPNSLNGDPVDDWYQWEYITDLTDGAVEPRWDLILRNGQSAWTLPEFGGIVEGYQKLTKTVSGREVPLTVAEIQGLPADASGDGVADSVWIRLPDSGTSRGKPVFAAVRIIDNCAMLNLNTAYCFYQTPYNAASPQSSFDKLWYLSQTAHSNGLAYLGTAFSSNAPYGDGGRYLTEINYLPFLRGSDLASIIGGGDGWYNIAIAKKFSWLDSSSLLVSISPEQAHDAAMTIEAITEHPVLPAAHFAFFDIGDELELRNRFLMTSSAETRFERADVANFSYDAGGNRYAALTVPREDKMEGAFSHFARWKWRVDPKNFNHLSGAFNGTSAGEPLDLRFRYDRRHISTFYSFDRPLRTGSYPRLELDALALNLTAGQRAVFMPDKAMPIDLRSADLTDAKTIVHLLYALREVYGAAKAAQIVANVIDYADADNAVTVLDTGRIAQFILNAGGALISSPLANSAAAAFGLDVGTVVYGYERQPFISEIYCFRNTTTGAVERFALELVNPYRSPINLNGWRITVGSQEYAAELNAAVVPAATGDLPAQYGRLTIRSGVDVPVGGGQIMLIAGFGMLFSGDTVIRLQRPDPANINPSDPYLTVDQSSSAQAFLIWGDGVRSSRRADDGWKFANNLAFGGADSNPRLGNENVVEGLAQKGYQLPVANDGEPFYRLADFINVAFIGNQKGGTNPKTITEQIADAADESDVRLDITKTPKLLDYICFLNRPEGSLPGRININTAAKHVIAAAIPPQLVMAATDDAQNALYLAEQIVAERPYERISDLLTQVPAFKKYKDHSTVNVGHQAIRGDFEERDWIVSRLANIFTVRSDTFTAYILVRLGHNGPERRMIAVFDRSQVWAPGDRPRLVALHPVPDTR